MLQHFQWVLHMHTTAGRGLLGNLLGCGGRDSTAKIYLLRLLLHKMYTNEKGHDKRKERRSLVVARHRCEGNHSLQFDQQHRVELLTKQPGPLALG